uniref:Uncharacterized protein n=1 Tax=Neogobius melanostomus TaxID=47308 RepID=A0A8C6T255_9GOBI
MKTAVITLLLLLLLLLLVIHQSMYNWGGGKICSNPIETCSGSNNLCGSIIIYAVPTYSKGCMSAYQCSVLNKPRISSARCCSTDLCNK